VTPDRPGRLRRIAIVASLGAIALMLAPARSAECQEIRRFEEVAPGIFRSAQPDPEDLRAVRERGVRTVLVLRTSVPKRERETAAEIGLEVRHVPMDGTSIPSMAEVDRALEVILDPSQRPVLVHCAHGEERTGAVIAAYRVVVQGWDPAEAEAEAKRLGFGFDDLGDFLTRYREHWLRR
jgi:protein tyrosine/serine phosphatase